jgi:hypothetical protein
MPSRILLISPVYYGIEKNIKSVLEESGNEVYWFENKSLKFDYHGTKSKLKFIRKIYYLLFIPHVRYIRRELKKIEDTRFDIIFSINGYIICPYLFRKLRSKNPELFSVLYLWDANSMYNWAKELKYFDKVYTFDRADAEEFGLIYKPNFYLKNSGSTLKNIKFDLFFVGKFTPSRLSFLDKLSTESTKYGVNSFFKLWPAFSIFPHNFIIYKVLKLLDLRYTWVRSFLLNYEAYEGILENEFILQQCLDFKAIQDLACLSNVIMDIPFQGQTGYTHRLIEALANGKKVLTTNASIKKEQFYNSDQIRVIDLKNPEFDNQWIKERVIFPVSEYFNDLELDSWLTSIIHAEVA